MAKPLGAKALLIREAISANPDLGNTVLAALINGSPARKEDKIQVKVQDVASQRQAMKNAGVVKAAPTAAATKPSRKAAGQKPGRQPGRKAAAAAAQPAAAPQAADPFELIEDVFSLAEKCGGFDRLKRLVDRLAPVTQPK